MSSEITVIVLRFMERILAVALGGALSYFGYRLFLHVPYDREGEGRFKLPGGTSVMLTRVGPGVFFALFGTAILATSFMSPVSFDPVLPEPNPNDAGGQEGTSTRGFRGVTPVGTTTTRSNILAQYAIHFEALNRVLPAASHTNLSRADADALDRAIREAKLSLMSIVWDEQSWGSWSSFRDWVYSGAREPPPELQRAAVAFFNQGVR